MMVRKAGMALLKSSQWMRATEGIIITPTMMRAGAVAALGMARNTGSVAGKEIAQVYVQAPKGRLEKPAQELKAFAKTRELQPGESQTLTMTIDAYTLASFNEATSAWETAAGNYKASFGASVADIRATAAFKVAKAQSWPVHKVLLPKEPVKEIAVN